MGLNRKIVPTEINAAVSPGRLQLLVALRFYAAGCFQRDGWGSRWLLQLPCLPNCTQSDKLLSHHE